MALGCLTRLELASDLSMALISVGLTVAFAVLARRRFAAGRTLRGNGMIAGAVTSGATATLWLACVMLGVPPFFMGVVHIPPCNAAEARTMTPELNPRHSPAPTSSSVHPAGPLERI